MGADKHTNHDHHQCVCVCVCAYIRAKHNAVISNEINGRFHGCGMIANGIIEHTTQILKTYTNNHQETITHTHTQTQTHTHTHTHTLMAQQTHRGRLMQKFVGKLRFCGDTAVESSTEEGQSST